MPSQVEVMNNAFVLLGVKRVADPNADEKQARDARAVWDLQRDATLAENPWSFATTRAELPALAAAPAYGYALAFPLPTDYLRMVEVGQDWVMYAPSGAEPRFAIEGATILCNEGSPLRIRYVRRIENVGDWSALFANAFAARLAMVLAEDLTQSAQKRDQAEKTYKAAITTAKRANAIERPPQRPVDDSWTLAQRS